MLADRYAFFYPSPFTWQFENVLHWSTTIFLHKKKCLNIYIKTTNYNKKSHGRAKRGKAFKILLWIWQEIEAKINHMAERSEAELSNFCSEFDGGLKQK